ncbi:MAG: helix-turn-helix domain-containing protein [Cyclobacteriaceae bacterium]|nr:helix-turn-helix domain-containing protein [Cyclobacteriaceae bacterium]
MQISAQNVRFIFGLKLKQLRAENNYSLSQLSGLTNISKSYLNEIEKGKKYPKPEKIGNLAKALNTSYDNLVSLQLSKQLTPISALVKSDILNELPLEFFGLSANDLLVILASAPIQFSAFVDALIRIGREHDFKVESLYFSVLRSFQEMNNNYFPELETAAKKLRKELHLDAHLTQIEEKLMSLLETNFEYQINLDGLKDKPKLAYLRYLLVSNPSPTLLINKKLTPTQITFILSREVSYNILNAKKRPQTSSWIETKSFEHVLNNFRSYYMASALLLDERSFTKGLVDFTKKQIFKPEEVVALIKETNVSSEVFMLRITNLVPRYFRYSNFFFTRYNHSINDNTFTLSKALNGAGLAQSDSNHLEDKACQRWVAMKNLLSLQKKQNQKKAGQTFCSIYKVKFETSNNQYLVISMTHAITPGDKLNCSISVGFLMDNRFMAQTNFAHDPAIKEHTVTYDWLKGQTNVYDGISNTPILAREQELVDLRSEIKNVLS